MRGRDLSWEAETCRARRRLVGDAAVRPRTGRLSSESLDEDYSKGTTILKLLTS
jgi:hypothetical protein